MVPRRTYNERHTEHIRNYGQICTLKLFKSDDVTKVESKFKASQFYKKNKTKDIPNDKGGSYDEIFKLTPTLTSDMIIRKIVEIGKDDLEELPSSYSLVVSKKNQTLEIEQEKTKQMQIQLEMMKFQKEQPIQQIEKQSSTQEVINLSQNNTLNDKILPFVTLFLIKDQTSKIETKKLYTFFREWYKSEYSVNESQIPKKTSF